MTEQTITIAVTDDHTLFRKGLISLIESLGSQYKIVLEAANGNDFITQINTSTQLPQLAIMDINMPSKNGYETVEWLNEHYPDIKVLVISMVEREEMIVRMLKLGVKGYLSKDVEPEDLKTAINSILQKGFYYTDFITGRLLHSLQKDSISKQADIAITDREKEALVWFCTELTYKEIADQMSVSIRTVDSFRDLLCKKLNVISRVGLVVYAIKNNIIEL